MPGRWQRVLTPIVSHHSRRPYRGLPAEAAPRELNCPGSPLRCVCHTGSPRRHPSSGCPVESNQIVEASIGRRSAGVAGSRHVHHAVLPPGERQDQTSLRFASASHPVIESWFTANASRLDFWATRAVRRESRTALPFTRTRLTSATARFRLTHSALQCLRLRLTESGEEGYNAGYTSSVASARSYQEPSPRLGT